MPSVVAPVPGMRVLCRDAASLGTGKVWRDASVEIQTEHGLSPFAPQTEHGLSPFAPQAAQPVKTDHPAEAENGDAGDTKLQM